jgi:A/G-specific adenine glycosylase
MEQGSVGKSKGLLLSLNPSTVPRAEENGTTRSSNALSLIQDILAWYAKNKRRLPWRAEKNAPADPYKIWLSEIMLQQTTVATVLPYFARFLERFPTVQTLAQASLQEIFVLWSGLGYYGRAQRLYETAQKLALLPSWPRYPDEWKKFPGIGLYTACAISAMAFNTPFIPVDGNIKRIFSRVFPGLQQASLKQIQKKAEEISQDIPPLTPFGDVAQGLMDFGALVCRPKSPLCAQCPLHDCYVRKTSYLPVFAHSLAEKGVTTQKPTPTRTRPPRTVRFAFALCFLNEKKELYVEEEKNRNLLKGLLRVPFLDVSEDVFREMETFPHYFEISHIFSHFEWRILLWVENIASSLFTERLPLYGLAHTPPPFRKEALKWDGFWLNLHNKQNFPLSSLMNKIIQYVEQYPQSPKECQAGGSEHRR